MHELMAATLDTVIGEIQRIKSDARQNGFTERPRWPMIVLRTPKGWTCPKEIDGRRTEGYWRSHQVPMGEMHENPAHVRILEEWMKSYQPAELFDGNGRLRPELAELAPRGARRMSANPHTNGGLLLRELRLPNFRDYAVEVTAPGAVTAESTRVMGTVPARCHEAEHGLPEFPAVQSGREQLKSLAGCTRGHQSCLGRGDRAMGRPFGARRAGHGDAERAPVPGLAGRAIS